MYSSCILYIIRQKFISFDIHTNTKKPRMRKNQKFCDIWKLMFERTEQSHKKSLDFISSHFSLKFFCISKENIVWINLGPLCVAQSSRYWKALRMIKDTTMKNNLQFPLPALCTCSLPLGLHHFLVIYAKLFL